jgi:hypothetical protein
MSPEAILDTGSGTNGARMRIGRVSLFVIWNLEIWLPNRLTRFLLYIDISSRRLLTFGLLDVFSTKWFTVEHPLRIFTWFTSFKLLWVSPTHKITFPPNVEDEGAVDAMKLCLRRSADERPPIIGQNGLLNEHYFLNSRRRPCRKIERYRYRPCLLQAC